MALNINVLKNVTDKFIKKTGSSAQSTNTEPTADASIFKNVSLNQTKDESLFKDPTDNILETDNPVPKQSTRVFTGNQTIFSELKQESADTFNKTANIDKNELTSDVEPLTETFAKSVKEHTEKNSDNDIDVDPSPIDLNLSAYNDKETISLKLSSILFFRQFFASFFQYTTLSLCFPQTASRLGPSYPSSMPFAYLLIGLISGAAAGFTSNVNLKIISGGLIFCVFITLSGLSSFRGICTLMCLFSQRRADEIISGVAVAIPCIIFTVVASALAMIVSPLELFLSFALISMLSAAFAVTLVFTLEQDPVNSIGTITIGGMIISALLTLALCFLILNPLVMVSLLGTGLLVRVIIGYFLHLNHVAASRDLILAATQISVIAMLLDLACIGSSLPVINTCVISLFN